MRKISVLKIRDTVKRLCLEANFVLRKDVLAALKKAKRKETNKRARAIFGQIIENARIAEKDRVAICQDTGIAVVFIELGRDVLVTGGDLNTAINEGVVSAYRDGYLRKSVVRDPVERNNTNTNTPAVISVKIVPGNRIRITVSPKGFGSENKSRIKMFKPTAGEEEIRQFIIDTVKAAGPDACPPLILGIGMGGTFEKCAYLAKEALLRPIGKRNPKKHISELEKGLASDINALGIGPMGLGGRTTVLGVNIEEFPTHIAGLPVAVNVSCHATRSASAVI